MVTITFPDADITQNLITCNENILGGIPVFTGTRVPVRTLFDYLKANHPLDDFLDDFPTVTRQQAQQVLNIGGSAERWSLKSRC